MRIFYMSETNIKGLKIIQPHCSTSNKDFLIKTYDKNEFEKFKIKCEFVQDNEVYSKKGVLRGMHVSVKNNQEKLIRVINGKILDVVIDLRKDSATYLSCFSIILSSENKKQLFIPNGLGHGYLALADSLIHFKSTSFYVHGNELSFSWRSKIIDVAWGIKNPIQNERDKTSKDFNEVFK